MSLPEIHQLKTNMEEMYDRIYTLQELIGTGSENEYLKAEERFMQKARELTVSLLTFGKPKQNSIKKESAIALLSVLIGEASGVNEAVMSKKAFRHTRKYALPRQVHMALLNVTFKVSLASAGALYAKDHATVLHAKKVVKNLYQTDRFFRTEYADVFDHCIAFDLSENKNSTIDFLNEKK